MDEVPEEPSSKALDALRDLAVPPEAARLACPAARGGAAGLGRRRLRRAERVRPRLAVLGGPVVSGADEQLFQGQRDAEAFLQRIGEPPGSRE